MNIIVRFLSVNILAGFRKRNTSIFDPSSQVTGFLRNIFVEKGKVQPFCLTSISIRAFAGQRTRLLLTFVKHMAKPDL